MNTFYYQICTRQTCLFYKIKILNHLLVIKWLVASCKFSVANLKFAAVYTCSYLNFGLAMRSVADYVSPCLQYIFFKHYVSLIVHLNWKNDVIFIRFHNTGHRFVWVCIIFVQLLVELEHLCHDFLVYFCRFNNVCPWK